MSTLTFGFETLSCLGLSPERRAQNWIDRIFENNAHRIFPRHFFTTKKCQQYCGMGGIVEFRENFEVWDGTVCIGKASPTTIAFIAEKRKGS